MRYLIMIGFLLVANFVSGSVNAQQPKPGFVSLPNDIRCDVRGAMIVSRPDGSNYGRIAQLVCWMSDNTPKQEKEIALMRLGGPSAAALFVDGTLTSVQFGQLQLDSNTTKVIAIGADKLQSFRDYLAAVPAFTTK
jgi:hypothetical protein